MKNINYEIITKEITKIRIKDLVDLNTKRPRFIFTGRRERGQKMGFIFFDNIFLFYLCGNNNDDDDDDDD